MKRLINLTTRIITPGLLILALSCQRSVSVTTNANSASDLKLGDIPANLLIDPASPSLLIPGDFTGLSFETRAFTNSAYFNVSNTVFINYLKGLGTGVIRVGGNTVDKVHWTNARRTPSTGIDSLATDDLDRFFKFSRATGWKVMFALNLGSGTQAVAVSEARYVYKSAADQLLCFEIGNEPDFYYQNGLRHPGYTFKDFEKEFDNYYAGIKNPLPGAVFSGPAAAFQTVNWVGPFAREEYSKVKWLTEHYYKMGPSSNPSVTIKKLLDGNGAAVSQARQMADDGRPHHLAFRFAECNSVFGGGKKGVSNTLASALWGLDLMFALAEQGSAGINFHGGAAGAYTPIAWSNGLFSARPLYYGMLFFKQASKGRLLPFTLTAPDSLNIAAHAVLQTDGTVLATLINKDLSKNAAVTINIHRPITAADLLRLTGPSPDSTSGITLGGSAVNTDGNWFASQSENAVISISRNTCLVKVPSASAVLVSLH